MKYWMFMCHLRLFVNVPLRYVTVLRTCANLYLSTCCSLGVLFSRSSTSFSTSEKRSAKIGMREKRLRIVFGDWMFCCRFCMKSLALHRMCFYMDQILSVSILTKYCIIFTWDANWSGMDIISRSSGMAKTILQGTVKGERRQGRQKKRWGDNITEWTGLKFAKSKRAVENREKWRKWVVKSAVVPQRPQQLRDRWNWSAIMVSGILV